jgi:hypothetical protein
VTTKLEKELRREVDIRGKPYTVTLSPDGVKLTEKGRRKGHELRWEDWASGGAALAAALNASLGEAAEPSEPPKAPEPPQAQPPQAINKSVAAKRTIKRPPPAKQRRQK